MRSRMKPVLTHRLACLTAALVLLLQGCSTALLPESEFEDDELEDDAAAPFDARVPADTGPTDARVQSDSGRDAGTDGSVGVDAGRPHDCPVVLPKNGFATLLTDDCGKRPSRPCTGQASLDQELTRIAQNCGLGSLSKPADLGFTLNSAGCPTQLRYDQDYVRGMISSCIQTQLEMLRFGCNLQCAIARIR